MREMDAFEQAYKNGFAAGMKAAEEKIVRCKDCKHLYFKDMSAYCPFKFSACRPNDFCSYGERRSDE